MSITVEKNRFYIADVNWHNVGGLGEPAFQNSWVNFGSDHAVAAYRMDQEGWVHLKGLVKSGSSGNVIFELPVGYRPRYNQRFTVVGSAGISCSVTVFTDGRVTPILMTGATNTYLSLAGVQFPAWQTWDELGPKTTMFNNQVTYFNDTSSTGLMMIERENGMMVVNGIIGVTTANGVFHYGPPTRIACLLPILGVNTPGYFQTTRGTINASAATTTYTICGGEFPHMKIADDFTSLAKLNSWVDYTTTGNNWGGLRYYKDKFGWVHIQGLVSTGSSATAVIATLPTGYRPAERELFITASNNTQARIDVYANGDIVGSTGASTTWISACSISFYAGG